MTVEIPTDLVPFVQGVIASGRCNSESDVVGEALRMFRDLELRREELRREIQEGIDSGQSIPGEQVFQRLRQRAATANSEKRVEIEMSQPDFSIKDVAKIHGAQ